MNISACIITNNNPKLLDCYESIKKYCNEIIIVETSGTEHKILKRKKNVKIFYFDWINDFSSARNYSISKATGEYILVIDSDEILRTKINKLPEYDFCFVKINYNGTYHWHIRFFRNNGNIRYEGKIHESIENSMKDLTGCKTNIELEHTGYETAEIQKEKIKRNYEILRQDVANPFYDFHLSRHYYSVNEYEKAIECSKNAMNLELNNENKSWLLNMMYDCYCKMNYGKDYGISLLKYSLELTPLQIQARLMILNYLIELGRGPRVAEMINKEFDKIKSISEHKNSDLPSDMYYNNEYINSLQKQIIN